MPSICCSLRTPFPPSPLSPRNQQTTPCQSSRRLLPFFIPAFGRSPTRGRVLRACARRARPRTHLRREILDTRQRAAAHRTNLREKCDMIMFPAFRSNRLCIRLWRLVGEGGCGGISEVLKPSAGAAGRGAREEDARSGFWGAVKRGEPVPASMKDLIYIHRRKTRKTVYQKSYRAGSDR